MFDLLGAIATRRPRRVLLLALLATVVAGVVGGPVAGLLGGGGFDDPGSETSAARTALSEASGTDPDASVVALLRPAAEPRSPAGLVEVREVATQLRDDPAVARVVTLEEAGDAFVSRDGRSTYLVAQLRPLEETARGAAATRLQEALADHPRVQLGGAPVAQEQIGGQVSADLARAELLAFPILFLISLWVFRSAVAALLPLLVGMVTILLTFLGLRLAVEIVPMSIFALNLVTGLGLGLAIDYSLFVVSRYREELALGVEPAVAVRRTLQTAGRTVVFSAATVAVALAALLVFPQQFLYSMGIGGVLVALTAGAVAVLLLPAVLVVLGHRVDALALPFMRRANERTARATEAGAWYRLSHFVMRRPVLVAVATTAVMLLLAAPALRTEFTSVDASVLPAGTSARIVDESLRADFPPDRTAPTYLAVRAGNRADAGSGLAAYADAVRRVPGVAAVASPEAVGDGVWRIDVTPVEGDLTGRTQRMVRDIRALPAPYPVLVGGASAAFVDQTDGLADRVPLAVVIVALSTFVILFLMTGSVLLPLKAVALNLLTVAAAFGVLVFIFQDGRLEGLLAYTSQGALEQTQPILLAAVAFGLSTDYGVFLLTRIKEARDSGLPDDEAVAVGLERTGRIITFAALLFCIAIGAFATSQVIFVKQVGLGTALAVLIDATLVRALLVPSLMALLGRWNWWAPAPLARLHARIGLGEAEAGARP